VWGGAPAEIEFDALSFKICKLLMIKDMTCGGSNFNDFPETVPTREITAKKRRLFFFSSVAVGLFLEWA